MSGRGSGWSSYSLYQFSKRDNWLLYPIYFLNEYGTYVGATCHSDKNDKNEYGTYVINEANSILYEPPFHIIQTLVPSHTARVFHLEPPFHIPTIYRSRLTIS